MRKGLFNSLVLCLAIGYVLLLAGCGSESGGTGDQAPPLVEQTFNEECMLCHDPGRIVDVAAQHSTPETTITGVIDAVTIVGGATTINFRLFNAGQPLAFVAPSNIRFTLAQLNPAANGNASFWQSYINVIETPDVGPGTTDQVQASSERTSTQGGVFVDNQDGSYSYTFSFDIQNVTSPVAVAYNPALTHRVAMQTTENTDNAIFEFVPDGSTPITTRSIVRNANCDECHRKLGFHGGDRIAVKYCVTCHNPGSTDANSGNTVDFKVMIHKIHSGEDLPSVQAGGEYVIYGFGDSVNDYSNVVFPQDRRNCTKCHDGSDSDTPDGDNWMNVPTIAACTSCHDDVNLVTGENHAGGAQPDNRSCVNCHPASGGAAGITDTHVIPEQAAAARFEYNILDVQNTGPGQFPVITFSVTDPTNGDAPYDILVDPEFNAPGGASRLAILIGWNSEDYTNTGSTSTPAQPISINPITSAVDNGDGTFTVTSGVAIPAAVTGSGVVAIEGHPAVESEPGVFDVRVPVKGVVNFFAVTDATPQARREVVDIANCDQCHGLLSLHGANRNDETQLCVICHNPDATDIGRRPGGSATTADGKTQETIDFKYLIHAIHAGASSADGFRTEGIVVYGFGGSPNDYSEVRYPRPLNDCEACHIDGSFELPAIGDNVLPTTIEVGNDAASPNDDINITPTASACSSCHDGVDPKIHMADQGANFEFVPFAPDLSGGDGSQVDLCGPGPITAQPAGHTERLDCCSCHSFR
ncbi:MAG: OmcA/MtrC family decaheme c-type cytochrome [Deltaproteobacteria bacterium]|nr:OmcA/MtrC family decaheme c-type cytochrome [Deltaproteobacteria bacterium]